MSARLSSSVDETARLIHMEQVDNGVRDITGFVRAMKEEHDDLPLADLMWLWRIYRGIDMQHPTHDINSGRPIRTT